SEFQAGIFSHEVRSGLLGAADADGDGQVSYREIAAFIERANAAVPNEKFRPDVYVKPPAAAPALLDLRPALARRLELGGDAPGQPLRLIRPANAGALFLRRAGALDEYRVEAGPAVLRFEDLTAQATSAQPRGAAHESFSLLFSLPFSRQAVETLVLRPPD